MTQASAPGKIILFGEHAVVYGRPALAVPVTQVHTDVDIVESSRPGIWIDAPDVDLHAELNALPSDHPIASVIHNFLFLWRVSPFPDLAVRIVSTIPVASGLGSGAAVTIALTRALASHLNHSMTDKQVNAFAYEIEKLHHGTPSGIDIYSGHVCPSRLFHQRPANRIIRRSARIRPSEFFAGRTNRATVFRVSMIYSRAQGTRGGHVSR